MRRSVPGVFLLYAVLAGGAVVFEQSLDLPWPPLLRSAVHNLIACLLFGTYASFRGRRPTGFRSLVAATAWITVVFSAASIAFAMLGSHISGSALTLVFAAVPFFTVFIQAQRDQGDQSQLAPAVVGLGGLALIVPFAFPQTASGIAALSVVIVCAGLVSFAGIRAHHLLANTSLLWAATMACGAAGTLSLILWLGGGEPVSWDGRVFAGEIAWGVAVGMPLVLLTLWLLRETEPVAFSTRFTLIPLVTVLIGIAMVRPPIPWTTWLGLLLTAFSIWSLVRTEQL